MSFDPLRIALHAASAAELEAAVLTGLQKDVGFDVAFFAYSGAAPTVVGLDAARVARAVAPGNRYEAELAPVKRQALATRGVAIERALFIGCGGAVAPRQFAQVYAGMRLDVVEREAAVARLARELFDVDTIPNLRLHVEDGTALVARADAASWDVAIVDAFDAHALASGFGCAPFFAELSRVVRAGGSFAFNVVGRLDGSGALRCVVDAAERHFQDLRVVPVVGRDERAFVTSDLRNVVVVGVKGR